MGTIGWDLNFWSERFKNNAHHRRKNEGEKIGVARN